MLSISSTCKTHAAECLKHLNLFLLLLSHQLPAYTMSSSLCDQIFDKNKVSKSVPRHVEFAEAV